MFKLGRKGTPFPVPWRLSACIYLLPSGALPPHSVCETPRQLTKLFTAMEKVLLSHFQERETEAHREA